MDEKFWLAIAFFSFVGLIVKYVFPIIKKQLEAKSKQIAEELLAAKEMKEKATEILTQSEKKYQEAIEFSKRIIADSGVEAQKYFDEATKLANEEIAKKMNALENRIKQEQERVSRELKVQMIESAIRLVQNNLQNVQKSQVENLVRKSAGDISKLIH